MVGAKATSRTQSVWPERVVVRAYDFWEGLGGRGWSVSVCGFFEMGKSEGDSCVLPVPDFDQTIASPCHKPPPVP
jgi:hypothetical protein